MSSLFFAKIKNYITNTNNEETNKSTMAAIVWTAAQKIDKITDNKTKTMSLVPFESFIW